jgi:hypothetical protein
MQLYAGGKLFTKKTYTIVVIFTTFAIITIIISVKNRSCLHGSRSGDEFWSLQDSLG